MAKRLITRRTIRAEKIDRGHTWIFSEIKNPTTAAGPFPKPVVPGLWDEEDVDRWLAAFISCAKEKRQQRPAPSRKTTAGG